jgi:hypothetical protein
MRRKRKRKKQKGFDYERSYPKEFAWILRVVVLLV